MKRKKLLLVALICGLLITLFPPAAAAAPGPSPPGDPPDPDWCNPMAIFLSELLKVECTELMEYQVDSVDVGFGVIMKAYFLSTLFTDLVWTDLVADHMSVEGLGWGQIMKAYYLASLLGLNAQDLLDLRSTMGWGEIIRQELGLGPGKPPWAGQGKPDWAGPRPWAKGGRCPPKSRSLRCTE